MLCLRRKTERVFLSRCHLVLLVEEKTASLFQSVERCGVFLWSLQRARRLTTDLKRHKVTGFTWEVKFQPNFNRRKRTFLFFQRLSSDAHTSNLNHSFTANNLFLSLFLNVFIGTEKLFFPRVFTVEVLKKQTILVSKIIDMKWLLF